MDLDPTFHEFLRSLSSRRVKYLVVGGYALAAHGWPRFTEDFDVWIEPTKANAHRVVLALADFGFPAYAAHEVEFATLDRMTHLGVPPLRIDIMTSITGVPSFRQAWASRLVVRLGPLAVPLLGRVVLEQNKRSTGRPKDLADLVLLGSIPAPDPAVPTRGKRPPRRRS